MGPVGFLRRSRTHPSGWHNVHICRKGAPSQYRRRRKAWNINDFFRTFRRDPGLCGRCGRTGVPEEKGPTVSGEEDDSTQPVRAR